MKIASIDIGTNSVILLITKIEKNNKIIPIFYKTYFPRIGKNIIKNKIMDESSTKKLIRTLKEIKKISEEHKCEKIFITGTAAFRYAQNKKEILNLIELKTGLKIKIISAKEEAYLTLLGVLSSQRKKTDDNFLIIDIGGGSIDLSIGNEKKFEFSKSYKFGVVTLKDMFIRKFPLSKDEETIFKIMNYLDKNLDLKEIKKFNFNKVYAVGGTPVSAKTILTETLIKDQNYFENQTLTLSQLKKIYRRIIELTPEMILKKYPAILKGREDVLILGIMILITILEQLNLKKIYISNRGIDFGLVYDFTLNHR